MFLADRSREAKWSAGRLAKKLIAKITRSEINRKWGMQKPEFHLVWITNTASKGASNTASVLVF